MKWLDGYVAIVTGASSGIGLAVLERFVDEGARAVALVRDPQKLASLEERFAERVVGVQGDVKEYSASARAVETALEHFGRLDALIANAGIFDFFRPLEKYTPETLDATFDEIFAVNVKGYLFAAHAAREALAEARGSIVFTSSIAGFHAACAGIVYTAAKHAIVGITRQLAYELAPEIRVNSVGPGGTLTPLSGAAALGHEARTILDNPEAGELVAQSVPLEFAQRPEDHAGLYVLLASRENARAVTGQVFMSDGGVAVRKV